MGWLLPMGIDYGVGRKINQTLNKKALTKSGKG